MEVIAAFKKSTPAAFKKAYYDGPAISLGPVSWHLSSLEHTESLPLLRVQMSDEALIQQTCTMQPNTSGYNKLITTYIGRDHRGGCKDCPPEVISEDNRQQTYLLWRDSSPEAKLSGCAKFIVAALRPRLPWPATCPGPGDFTYHR